MVLLSRNQDKNILDEVVITKFEILPNLLKVINLNPKILQNRLRKEANISGGKIYHSVKALKAMRLVTNGNGNGLTITALGRNFLEGYLLKHRIPENVIKEACLNVILFNKVYAEYGNETDPRKLFKIFQSKIKEDYLDINRKLIGSAVRRYLQAMHNIKLRAGARTGSTTGKKFINQTNLSGLANVDLSGLANLGALSKLGDKEERQIIATINMIEEIKKKLPLEKAVKKYSKNIIQTVINHL